MGDPLERLKESRLLCELQNDRRRAIGALDPGQKMKAAFSLSVEARKLLIAGLRAQGFTDLEIQTVLRSRRK
jgi:ABC-type uncharacterized transport system auxiliary subunit